MKSRNSRLFGVLLLSISVMLAACGGGSKDSTTPAPPPASLAMKGTSGNAVNMNGTWTGCMHNNTNQEDELSKITFSGGSIAMNTSIWSAATTSNCFQTTTPDMIMAGTLTAALGSEGTATWTNGSGSTSPPAGISVGAKATKATLVFTSFTITPKSAAYVTRFNYNTGVCGKTNWAIDVATDVLGCADIMPSTTMTDYWVIDDSAAVLKWYAQDIASAAYEVDSINPMLK